MLKPSKTKTEEKFDPRKAQHAYLSRVEGELEKQGVLFFDANKNLDIDEEYLTLPFDITNVTSQDLGEYLNAFTQQKVYHRTLLGRAELLLEQARRDYLDASSPLYKGLSYDKLSETAKDRIINGDKRVIEHYHSLQDREGQVNLLRYAIENIEDIIFMLSRELTRRAGDLNDETRAANAPRRRR